MHRQNNGRKGEKAKSALCGGRYHPCRQSDKAALQEFGVDGIVLGCANYSNADGYIERRLGVPVLEGVACALILAFGLVHYQKCKEKY